MKCKRCLEIELQEGLVLVEIFRPGADDFFNQGPDSLLGRTMVPSGQSRLVQCLKCPNCGYSLINRNVMYQ